VDIRGVVKTTKRYRSRKKAATATDNAKVTKLNVLKEENNKRKAGVNFNGKTIKSIRKNEGG